MRRSIPMRRVTTWLAALALLHPLGAAAAEKGPPAAPERPFSASTGALFDKRVTISTPPGVPLGNVVDTSEATIAFWLRGTRANGGPGGPDDVANGPASTATLNNFALFANDRRTNCEASNGSPQHPADGWCIAPLDNSTPGGQYSFNDAEGTGAAHGVNLATAGWKAAFSNGRWNFLIATYKKGHCALYNGVTSATTACPGNISSLVVNNLASRHGAYIWNAVEGLASFGYLQDFYLSQAYIGCTGRGSPYPDCRKDDTIAPSILARFIRDGRPVDLGPDCSGPSGRQPAICLTGDARGMQANKGYATGLALRSPGGAPLDPGAGLDDSPYSAAGVPTHQVTLKHIFFAAAPSQTGPGGGHCASNAASGCTFGYKNDSPPVMKPNSGGQALAVGDLRVLIGNLTAYSQAHDFNAVCPTTASGAWTRVVPAGPAFDSATKLYSFVCYVFVTSPAEEDYVSGVSWTGLAAPVQWTMLTYSNVAAVQSAKAVVRPSGSTMLATPAANLGGSPSKLVSIWTNGQGAGQVYAYAGPGKIRLRATNFAGPVTYVVDEDVARGAKTQRDLTRNNPTHSGSVNFYLSLVPN